MVCVKVIDIIFIDIFVFSLCLLRVLGMVWVTVFYQMCLSQIFLPVRGLSSHTLDIVFWRADVFNFNEIQFISCFHGSCL